MHNGNIKRHLQRPPEERERECNLSRCGHWLNCLDEGGLVSGWEAFTYSCDFKSGKQLLVTDPAASTAIAFLEEYLATGKETFQLSLSLQAHFWNSLLGPHRDSTTGKFKPRRMCVCVCMGGEGLRNEKPMDKRKQNLGSLSWWGVTQAVFKKCS